MLFTASCDLLQKDDHVASSTPRQGFRFRPTASATLPLKRCLRHAFFITMPQPRRFLHAASLTFSQPWYHRLATSSRCHHDIVFGKLFLVRWLSYAASMILPLAQRLQQAVSSFFQVRFLGHAAPTTLSRHAASKTQISNKKKLRLHIFFRVMWIP